MRTLLVHAPTLSVLTLLVACGGDAVTPGKDDAAGGGDSGSEWGPVGTDQDGDGVTVNDGDCDDGNAALYPGRAEDCDGIDNNCNGVVDEGLPDADGDRTADCVDAEECDGVDNNGDGVVDEGFSDSDGDGSADCVGTERCDGVDNNGNGEVDEGYDVDGDGYTTCAATLGQADCDDANADVYPGAVETDGDGLDNNCNGIADEGVWSYGDLAIVEVMNNPQRVGDPQGEWFEVYNTTDRTLTLNGLTLTDSTGERHIVSSTRSLTLEPGGFFVFGSNADRNTNGDAPIDYTYPSDDLILGNGVDDLSVYAGDVLIDMITWDDGASMPDPDGASMGLDNLSYGPDINDNPEAWCVAIRPWTGLSIDDKGSPGEDNEYCSTFDHDGDGFSGDEGDCDEGDITTYPGAWEGTDPTDNDCDGYAETAPVAVVSSSTDGYTCNAVQLDGSGSYDLEGAGLSYAWELVSAPAGSARTTSNIVTTTSAMPTFRGDVAGDYTFGLTVNDGGTGSLMESHLVTLTDRPTNTAPAANAGSDQTYSGSATCTPVSYGSSTYTCSSCTSASFTLDASSSSDAEGDDLSYSWTMTSGSSMGSLSATSGSSVTLTFSSASATYGSSTNNVISVEVTATDCQGLTSTDTVDITYTCTGV
jgi:hypothetical protein